MYSTIDDANLSFTAHEDELKGEGTSSSSDYVPPSESASVTRENDTNERDSPTPMVKAMLDVNDGDNSSGNDGYSKVHAAPQCLVFERDSDNSAREECEGLQEANTSVGYNEDVVTEPKSFHPAAETSPKLERVPFEPRDEPLSPCSPMEAALRDFGDSDDSGSGSGSSSCSTTRMYQRGEKAGEWNTFVEDETENLPESRIMSKQFGSL